VNMSNRFLVVVIAILISLIIGLGLFWKPDLAPAPAAINPLPPGGDFLLQSATGPITLTDYRGSLSILYFGYTFCPDICPTNLATLSAGMAMLTPEERKKLAVFFISVDPRRDTPEHLKTYVEFFDRQMLGVTGTSADIVELAARYGVYYAEQPAEMAADGYVVDHSSDSFIVGADGRLVARMAHGTSPEQVVALIRQYMNPG